MQSTWQKWCYSSTSVFTLIHTKFCQLIHPHVIPNLYDCSLEEQKIIYFEECLGPNNTGPHWFALQGLNIQNIICVPQKKVMNIWNDMRVNKWWQNVYFWVSYPFKKISHWFGFQNAALHLMKQWEMSEALVSLITPLPFLNSECNRLCQWRVARFQQQQSVAMKCSTVVKMFWAGKWTAGLTVAACAGQSRH